MVSDVTRQGRTVLFVSHNMVAVEALCRRAIWLERGRLLRDGRARDVIAEYLHRSTSPSIEQVWPDIATAPGNDAIRLRAARVLPVAALGTSRSMWRRISTLKSSTGT